MLTRIRGVLAHAPVAARSVGDLSGPSSRPRRGCGAERDAVELPGADGVGSLVGAGRTLQVELTAKGEVELTSMTFPLEGVDEALHALDEGRMIGHGILVPNQS